jgi:hypothetical protein
LCIESVHAFVDQLFRSDFDLTFNVTEGTMWTQPLPRLNSLLILHQPCITVERAKTRRTEKHRHQHHRHSQFLLSAASLLAASKPKHALDHSAKSPCVSRFESKQSLIEIEWRAREIKTGRDGREEDIEPTSRRVHLAVPLDLRSAVAALALWHGV